MPDAAVFIDEVDEVAGIKFSRGLERKVVLREYISPMLGLHDGRLAGQETENDIPFRKRVDSIESSDLFPVVALAIQSPQVFLEVRLGVETIGRRIAAQIFDNAKLRGATNELNHTFDIDHSKPCLSIITNPLYYSARKKQYGF